MSQKNTPCRSGRSCERTTSENYLHALPMLLAGRVRLIDNATLRSQLASLERQVSAADRETVSHPRAAMSLAEAIILFGLRGAAAAARSGRRVAARPLIRAAIHLCCGECSLHHSTSPWASRL
jgi:hypothetical protein